ncbi:MAG TPA: lipocalin-like domain-containing protein [Solirubrobacterales bacterium]|nr:lipocalin-like domain-containing protein [Solirubrobacterales bacterium]
MGEWTLVAWTGVDGEGRRVDHGGGSPRGELIYLAGGRMAVQIQHDGRRRFGSRDWGAGSEAERAAAYAGYNAYCGTFSVPEPGVVVHHVELAIHPDQPGMDKRRRYALEGDELVLRTQDVETANGPASSELRWRRRRA